MCTRGSTGRAVGPAIFFWYAFGVARINSKGWGCSKDYALCRSVELLSYCTGATPVLKAQCLPPNWGRFVSSWESCCCKDSLVKFQGVGVVVKFDLFSHCYAVFLCCLRAACKQLPTPQIMFQVSKQLSWWLLDLVLLSSVGLDCLGRPVAMKNGVNWGDGFAIGDVNTKNCPLKCFFLQTNEESFTFVTFKTDVSIKW